MSAQDSPPKMKELQLPISRVKTIMKSSPNVETIGQDGLHLVVKATELFIHHFAKEAFSKKTTTQNTLDYKQLAEVVQTNDTLEFLREIMPRKITVRQFKEMMARKNAENSSDSESDSQSDSASGSESGSEEEEENIENGNSSESESNTNKENGNSNKNNSSSENSESE